MSIVFRSTLVVVLALVASPLLSALTCELIQLGPYCGHNVGLLLMLYFAAGVVLFPFALSWLLRPPMRPAHPPLCSHCGEAVTYEASSCPKCGFQFGHPRT